MRREATACGRKGQGGFTLFEIVSVLSIILILTAIALMMVQGVVEHAKRARLADERVTISLAASGFFVASRSAAYPVTDPGAPGPRLRPIDFDAPLPQDPGKTFVPHFLKEVPKTAPLVRWQIDVVTGAVSIADQGA